MEKGRDGEREGGSLGGREDGRSERERNEVMGGGKGRGEEVLKKLA